jgi:hypothetical protein
MSIPIGLKFTRYRIVIEIMLLAAVVWYAAFDLPFHFPPGQRLWSASYAFGFNNRVSMLGLIILLGLACLIAARHTRSRGISFGRTHDSSRPLWLAFILMSVLYGCATFAMYRYQVTAAPWLMWEVRHLNYRTLLMDIYHLHPYTNFSAEYGPLLTYAPLSTYRLGKIAGASYQQAYFATHLLLNIAGLWCAAYLLSNVLISNAARLLIFVPIAVSGFAPYMGINGVLLRYLLPFATLLIVWRTLPSIESIANPLSRWFSTVGLIMISVSANLSLSAEIGLAFVVAWLAYCVVVCRVTLNLLTLSLISVIAVGVLWWVMLPRAYYTTVIHFSTGANNLPLLPSPHLLLYLITIFVVVPSLVGTTLTSPGWNNRSNINTAFGVLCVAMMPGALGRCDPPHVLLYGMGATLLLLIWLAQWRVTALVVCVSAYVAVFVIWMGLVNLRVFYNIQPRALLSRQGIHQLVRRLKQSGTIEPVNTLSVLDPLPRIGLPFVTFGDPVVERYVVEHGRLEPDYYVSIVGLYSSSDVERKLRDLARMEYILVPPGFGVESRRDPCRELQVNLQKWFLSSFSRRCVAQPLDPTGEIDSYISRHFVTVQNVGSCVLMRRALP